MTPTFFGVNLRTLVNDSFKIDNVESGLLLSFKEQSNLIFHFYKDTELILNINTCESTECHRCFDKSALLYVGENQTEKHKQSYVLTFLNTKDLSNFLNFVNQKLHISNKRKMHSKSTFDERTDSWSAVQYFQFYSYLSQQQNMMQDYIRTSTYQRAILANASVDFNGKVVLDVGAGSGILSFFAIQAGAKRVYAVEASNMAAHCNTLVQSNKLAGRIVVVSGKIEDIVLPEPVDVIISEPMGYMLYNERMLETYVHARKFLGRQHRRQVKTSAVTGSSEGPDGDTAMHEQNSYENDDDSFPAEIKPGVMFPSVAQLYVVPFCDEALFAEQHTKANFWYQQSFHGMDLSALRTAAIAEYFNQPVVDTFDIGICPAVPCVHKVDFRTVKESELADIEIPLHFQITQCATIHGLAFWFDVGFLGSQKDVWLSTSPTEPLTHWYQVRCLLGTALFVQEGQILTGFIRMKANTRQSYDVDIELVIPGSDTKITNKLDLKNPHFRYTGYPPAPPPGSHSKPPTESYYAGVQAANNVVIQQHASGLNSVAATGLPGDNIQQYNGSGFIQQTGNGPVVFTGNMTAGANASQTGAIHLIHDQQNVIPMISGQLPGAVASGYPSSIDHITASSLPMPSTGILSPEMLTNGWPNNRYSTNCQ